LTRTSYEAREYGIKTGWKLKDAKIACPHIIRRGSRPERYAEISAKIMQSFETITPAVEVFSIDECFLDLKPVLHLYSSVESLAEKIRQVVFQASEGLRCSIGISEGKLTAKFCAKLKKGGTTIIEPEKIKAAMSLTPVSEICGIGKQMTKYLNERGVVYCQDIERFPVSILASRFGDIGRRLYLTCLGHDPFPVESDKNIEPKGMGHSKVLPPKTTDKDLVYGVLANLCHRLSTRLRKHGFLCKIFSIGYKSKFGWQGVKVKTLKPINDSKTIADIGKQFLDKAWHQEALYYISINALVLEKPSDQLELFGESDEDIAVNDKRHKLDQVIDEINERFGKNTIKSAVELQAKDANMIPVISPAWRPNGAKRSI
jgi:DNA polymerase-4